MKNRWKELFGKYGKKGIIILVIAILCSFLGECVWNLDVLKLSAEERGVHTLALEELYTEGFQYENGTLVMTGQPAMIRLDNSYSYISKLEYTYEYGYDFTAVIRIYPTAEAEEQQSFVDMADGNNRLVTCSEVKLEQGFDHADLIFPEGIEGITITGVAYDNSFHMSGRRILATATCIGLLLFVILCSEIGETRLEYAYLVIGLTTCVTMLVTFPAQKVSWDEAYHFRHAYELGLGTQRILSPEVQYYGSDDEVATLLYPRAAAEFNSLEAGLNESDIYHTTGEGTVVIKSGFAALNDIGHIASAVGIGFARLFHMPLTAVYRMGKLFNALLYLGVTSFAIRRMKSGKRLMTALALMPTPLFLASSYSYDATLNAFVLLGLAYMLSEFVERESYISWKSYGIFIGSMFIASGIKMLYAPLLLLVLFLPKKKFRNTKTMLLMKIGILVVCGALLGAMLLPTLLQPSGVASDTRGGDTSTAGQLAVIFGNPLGYAKLLVMQIVSSGVDFTLGNGIYGTMAHYGYFPFGGYITVFMTFMVLTDVPETGYAFRKRERIGMLAIAALIICFIWTAMYISFTPVGAGTINGVQGRYFIPIILPLMLAIQPAGIENRIPPRIYHAITLGVPVLLSYSVVVYKVLGNAS